MKRTIAVFPLVVLFLVCADAHVLAQGTYNAASCSQSAVNAVINGPSHVAVDGDTINVPSGSCSWTQGITINVGIAIIGAGSSSTTITDNFTGGQLITWNIPSATSSLARLSGLTLAGGSSGSYALPTLANIQGTCNTTTCSNIRWDNLTLSGWVESTNFNNFFVYLNNVFGVIDHNTITITSGGGEIFNIGHSAYINNPGGGANGDNSWAQPDSFGTPNALYLESNTVSAEGSALVALTETDQGGGARFVARFNTLTNINLQTHGTESTGRTRGARQVEAYNNTDGCTNNSGGCGALLGLRSGAAFVFDNSLSVSGGAWWNFEVSPTVYRAYADFTPWGTCDGSGPYDQNDGTVYSSGAYSGATGSQSFIDSTKAWTTNEWALSGGYPYSLHNTSGTGNNGMSGWGEEISSNTSDTVTPLNEAMCNWGGSTACTWTNGNSYQILRARACIDQPGRGGNGATYISGTTPTPTGWVNEPLDPVYEWGSTESGGKPSFGWVYPIATQRLIANRDYYSQNASFNGTSGTGTGPLASRPSTCATGVAYWADDQGSWNQSGSGGQGQLYLCTATNTWSLYYTPYTYPHPLTTGTILDPPNPPSGLNAVVQ